MSSKHKDIVNQAIWTLSHKLGIKTTNTAALPFVEDVSGEKIVDLMSVDFYQAIESTSNLLASVPNDRPTLKDTLEHYKQIFELFAGYAQRVSDLATNINDRHSIIKNSIMAKSEVDLELVDATMEKYGFGFVQVEMISSDVESTLLRHKLAKSNFTEEDMTNAISWCLNALTVQ